jgi:hypothetical protein
MLIRLSQEGLISSWKIYSIIFKQSNFLKLSLTRIEQLCYLVEKFNDIFLCEKKQLDQDPDANFLKL